jgi:hypothetical protein
VGRWVRGCISPVIILKRGWIIKDRKPMEKEDCHARPRCSQRVGDI